MSKIRIAQNTTAVDVAFNLSGSLTGFPVVIAQLPAGSRVGFDDLPDVGEDVLDIGQTWTPDIQGMTLELDVPLYNTLGEAKKPYSTDLQGLEPVVAYGNAMLKELINPAGKVTLGVMPFPQQSGGLFNQWFRAFADIEDGLAVRVVADCIDAGTGENTRFLARTYKIGLGANVLTDV